MRLYSLAITSKTNSGTNLINNSIAQNDTNIQQPNIENMLPQETTDILPKTKNNTSTNILDQFHTDKLTAKEEYGILNQKLVNRGYYVDKLAERTGNLEIKYKYDRMLGAVSEGQYEIAHAQTDNNGKEIGKSINEIWKPAEDSKLVKEFSEYLLHKHNIDRFARNKPIFGENIDSDISKLVSDNYEKLYPQFKEWGKDIRTFYNNQMQNMVDAGLTSKEAQVHLDDMYSNYFIVSRAVDNDIAPKKEKTVKTNNPIKKAVGGNADIQPLKDAMSKQAIAVKQAIRINELGKEMLKVLPNAENAQNYDYKINDNKNDNGITNNVVTLDENGAKFIIFDEGKSKELKIDKGLYESLKPIQKYAIENTTPMKIIQKASEMQRSLLTVDNPLFIITNFFKDLQDGMFNSKYASKFLTNYGKALMEIKNKGELYKLYKANGGEANTYFDYEKGIKRSTKIGKFLDKIRNANEVVEMAPRLAEFISTYEAGKSIDEAMYNAAEVTTNFKRGGEITKVINRNGVNFLNASVQGLSKLVRNLSGQRGLKGYTNLLLKAIVLGVAPSALNYMLLGDDEDYQDLPDYAKDTYYIFKTGDGQFIRIPKGRVLSLFGSVAVRTIEYAKGNKEAYKGLGQTIVNQIAPNNPAESNLASPLGQALSNTTWYGGQLVPTRLQNELPKNQYDETTDSLSKFIGQKLNISPIKLNYALDQYSGGLGDVILPFLTPQANNGILAPLTDKFTIDSVLKNRNVSKFYEVLDYQTKLANDSEANDEDILKKKYLDSINKQLGDLMKEKREIQMSDLKNDVKREDVRNIQSKIVDIAKEALSNYDNVDKGSNYAQVGDNKYYLNSKNEWTSLSEDEEDKNTDISLKTYADYKQEVYETKQFLIDNNIIDKKQDIKVTDKINIILKSNYSDKERTAIYENYIKSSNDSLYDVAKKVGINIKDILKYKLQDFSSDKEDDGTVKGKTVSGSGKSKVISYLNTTNLSYDDKLVLLGLNYALEDNEQKKRLFTYINNKSGLSKKEKIDIFTKMDSNFTVNKDGTIKIKYK